jgi:hypothetical protein
MKIKSILFFQETLRKIIEASKPILEEKNLDSTPNNKITTKTTNREQQTTLTIIDPVLITTIHSNKGAIDTIRGQITELRHDVDQLRTEINHRKVQPNFPMNNETRRVSKAEVNTHNQTSVSHHHHHHHHVEQPVTTGNSSVCIIL